MKKGFTLITAIVFIVLIATIAALALSFASFSTKQTSDLYLREQAELLLQSSTEFALLAISGHDIAGTNTCLNTLNISYPTVAAPLFDIDISIGYIGNGLPAGCNTLNNNISTADSNVTVIIDTIVTDHNVSSEPIRLHRRTIQKP
jgi:type II secretory pathway pseudopilin PulG